MVRSMMSLTNLPLSFWDYALESAARIPNMVPTKKVWGCEAHVKRHTPDKLKQRSVKCIFVGYPKETMGYYFYYPPENKIIVERYAHFLEKDFILQKESGRKVELDDEDILPSKNTSEHPIKEESLASIVSQEEDVVLVIRSHSLGDLNEPANYKAALSYPEFKKWLVAMNEKMQSMNDNKVWKLVVLPPNAKVVKIKWIYKKKTNMDGKVYIYKARLVAKGFTQTYGVDYEETFSLVADIRAIRILIAIAAYYDYEIWQMDVKTAFLNGFLEEEIYMEQPEGFIDPNHPSKVCKLQRSIYGLKQASRSWNKRFDEEIKKFGFHQNLDEPCVYQKASGSNVIFLILYVDDIILMGNHIPSLQEVKDYLEMKRMQNVPYASTVGSIMYVVRCTRPDVAFAQNITSRFQQNSGEAHWTTIKNILKYLRNTKDTFLVFGGDPEAELRVNCYCDGFETDRDDMKSQTGYVFVLNGGAVVWKSSKQSTTAQHATEAEYIAASEAAKEAVWIRKFIDELSVVLSNDYSIKINCDNSAAIIMAKESGIQKGA
ncbi:retrotransposon protein, putative, ty1-copia subclass [Tanacetum coccineum]